MHRFFPFFNASFTWAATGFGGLIATFTDLVWHILSAIKQGSRGKSCKFLWLSKRLWHHNPAHARILQQNWWKSERFAFTFSSFLQFALLSSSSRPADNKLIALSTMHNELLSRFLKINNHFFIWGFFLSCLWGGNSTKIDYESLKTRKKFYFLGWSLSRELIELPPDELTNGEEKHD